MMDTNAVVRMMKADGFAAFVNVDGYLYAWDVEIHVSGGVKKDVWKAVRIHSEKEAIQFVLARS